MGFLVGPVFIFNVCIFAGCTCSKFTGYVFFTRCTCCISSGNASTIDTVRGYTWLGIWSVFGLFSMIGWLFRSIYCGTTLGSLPYGVALSNISAWDINASVWESTSMDSGLSDATVFRACINSCATWMVASVDDIFGMLYFEGKNSTVTKTFYALVLGIKYLWHL